jgi:mRNA interferase MazF
VDSDFKTGKIEIKSNIRPNRLFTADKNLIIKKVGTINQSVLDAVVVKIIDFLK